MSDTERLRDYGRPNPTDVGKPEIIGSLNQPCPNCGCAQVFAISVQATLMGMRGVGTYVGCAACPWASEMMMRRSSPNEMSLRSVHELKKRIMEKYDGMVVEDEESSSTGMLQLLSLNYRGARFMLECYVGKGFGLSRMPEDGNMPERPDITAKTADEIMEHLEKMIGD